jgi:hypothetical protein
LTNLWDVDIRAFFLWRAVPARLIRKPTPEENIALRGFFWVGKSYSSGWNYGIRPDERSSSNISMVNVYTDYC